MLDEYDELDAETGFHKAVKQSKTIDFSVFSKGELVQIRDYVNKLLGEVPRIDLRAELVENLTKAKEARNKMVAEVSGGSTGLAATISAVTTALKEIAKLELALNDASMVEFVTKTVIAELKGKPAADKILEEIERRVAEYEG